MPAAMTSGRRRDAVVAVVVLAAAAILACGGSPASPAPAPAPLKRLLVVTHTAGFRHSSIPIAETTIRDIGSRNGLCETEFCRTADDVQARLTTDGLRGVDAVFFANTTGNLGIPDMAAFLDWVRAGHGFLGAHSASDTYHESIEFLTMLGGEFNTHGAIAPGDIRVDDASDPSVAHLAPRFTITDELYRFDRNSRAAVHALLSMDRLPKER